MTNMAMTAVGKNETAREEYDLRNGRSRLWPAKQEEITERFWTYPAITHNEKERCRERLRGDGVILDRYYKEDDEGAVTGPGGLGPETPMGDQSMCGDLWCHLPHLDREALCNEEWALATLENRRRVMVIIEDQRKVERWMEDLLRDKREKGLEEKRRRYDVWNVREAAFTVIGKDGKVKGGKGEAGPKKGGERERIVKAPARLKRQETDCGVLVPLGSKASGSTLSE